jgi:hypothetical protein
MGCRGEDEAMDIDKDKIDKVVLALLWLTSRDEARAWKVHDWDAMNPLCENGHDR